MTKKNNQQLDADSDSCESFDEGLGLGIGLGLGFGLGLGLGLMAANDKDLEQSSTDDDVEQIVEDFDKTLAFIGNAWTSTRKATDKFVKEKNLDKSWKKVQTKASETSRRAGDSMNKMAKNLELEKKWKTTVDKSASLAVKVKESTEKLVGKKNSNKADETLAYDIPPSSAPIIYNDLGDGTALAKKTEEKNIAPTQVQEVATLNDSNKLANSEENDNLPKKADIKEEEEMKPVLNEESVSSTKFSIDDD